VVVLVERTVSSLVAAAVEAGVGHSGKKKRLAEERKTFTVAALPLVNRLLVQEKGFCVKLMLGRPVMRVVVAEGHGGERKKREDLLQKKN
jgi:hypothetical protein